MKTEAELWREERERIQRKQRPPKLWARWEMTLPEPEPDHFVWHDVAELCPVIWREADTVERMAA